MRESLDQMLFVYAAFAVTIIATLLLVGQSWLTMRKAEARRDKVKGK
ncbi:hypothetical protein [Aurantiacibacter sediminis]|uniref:Heme exporter protein D n=1 Tax=Aurantiacibacter sediminis TaxID=2793064 RepID=A0ABS0N534_9SPHN|nr:hypothetical protein [Aurantiacibacter sediminis]MBH5322896.1 hypothetical protein [Aurantiacibacter sediminis]